MIGQRSTACQAGLARRVALGLAVGGLATGLIGGAGHALAAAPKAADLVWPSTGGWATLSPSDAGMDSTKLAKAIAYANQRGGSGFVSRHGYQVATWGTATAKYDLRSAVKGIGSLLVGQALQDGNFKLTDTVLTHLTQAEFAIPAKNATLGPGWLQKITLQHLMDHTAGFAHPGGFKQLFFAPGTFYHYSNCGANWMGDVATVTFQADLDKVVRDTIIKPLGITATDMLWRTNAYRPPTIRGIQRREFAAGLAITARGLARIGLMLMRGGRWRTQQIIPPDYLAAISTTRPELAKLIDTETKQISDLTHYNLYWENNANGVYPDVPRNILFLWGNQSNHLFVLPSQDLIVVRIGDKLLPEDGLAGLNKLVAGFLAAVN